MSDANVDPYEVEERTTHVHEHDVVVVEREPSRRGELVKFAILVIIMLGTILVVALLRPYIFNTLIPAVMGEGQPAAPLVSDEAEAETIKPENEEMEATAVPTDSTETETATEEETNAENATEEEAASSEEVVSEPEQPADFPTAVPARTHTVQPGETLTSIAQQYGVTVQAIVAANEITNPDRVTVGTTLIIPESQ